MSAEGATVVEVVVRTVARCRRRMQLVSAGRRAGFTIPLAIVAVELLALAIRPAAGELMMLAASAGALAVAAAVIPSVLRAPTLRATAAAIDTRLRLQDRVVTALQLVDDGDPMAQLVVRDAGARLATISPSHVFPLEAPSHFFRALSAAAVTTVVFLAIAGTAGRSWLSAVGGSDGATGAGAGRSGRAAQAGSNARIVEGGTPSASTARPRESTGTPANRDDTPVGRESIPNNADTRTLARGGNGPGAARPQAAAPRRDDGTASGMRDGGRGATGFAERTASAAGGVSGTIGADPRRAPGRALAAVPGNATSQNQYRMAAARAQTAIAQERVPARLRTYVKRYFVAIRP